MTDTAGWRWYVNHASLPQTAADYTLVNEIGLPAWRQHKAYVDYQNTRARAAALAARRTT